ncbi:Ig-like domain-containing protein [Curtobacterium sp. MCBD17_028]|uniref:Ig-like domain-containing protein n=1 Tax=Curtobacterium sp. MCBD17_028 TaxID=2175670 RepID=UPI000DA99512|nr:Ig-like domain-containing protein [Curtobacterium sp. MCBD17_028]PZE27318.1 hypothetical protein DEI86_07480 [Curtobacterium sp. MCBD17_028]
MYPKHALVRRVRIPIVGGVTLAVAGALVLAAGPAAHATEVSGAITNVTVSPTTPVLGSQLRTSIDWCAPADAHAGDTFGLTLSDHLGHLPTGFDLDDPATGVPVATATIAQSTPWIVSFTFTDYVDTHRDTCGTAYVQSDFNGTTTPGGVTTPITSTTSDGRQFTTPITPTGPAWGDPAAASKYGTWARPDQGRTNPTDAVVWHIDTPNGPFASATTTDAVPAGQTWQFDCGTVRLSEGSYVDGVYTHIADLARSDFPVTCSTSSVTVSWPTLAVADQYRVEVATSEQTANGDGPARTEQNVATVTTRATDGTTATTDAGAQMIQASAGGMGQGVAVAVAPIATPTPSPSGGTASVSPAGASAVPAAAAATDTSGSLAFTGQDDRPAIALGSALLLAGIAVLALARRRRLTVDAPESSGSATPRHGLRRQR